MAPHQEYRGGNPQESVVEPRKGKSEKDVPPGIIMSFTPPDLRLILKQLGASKTPSRKLDFWRLWVCRTKSPTLGVAGPAFGAPAAVVLLERLLAMGAKAIVGVGSCGSLQSWLQVGSVVLPDSALVEEGTSPHYLASHVKTRPHQELFRLLKESLEEVELKPRAGRIWTTDAIFRETREKVLLYQREGVLAVDMESSALMSAASFRRVPFASVMVVSDELGTLRWHRGFKKAEFQEKLGQAALAAARCLERWLAVNLREQAQVDL
ncbi:MAG: nucleoside phosphorylase [bacterium]